VCYEQALAALEHLPATRATTEQAIDLRLSIRPAFNALGEAPARMLDHLRHAEALAQTLGDPLRLGRVYADLDATLGVAGEMDRAIISSQRALAVAATLGHIGLQARAHLDLGRVYYDTGDYARAVESLEWNVATLQRELLYERFGSNNIVAAVSRAWLSYCHAERGAFTEGLAMATERLRIAETGDRALSQIEACSGISVVYLRQGDVQQATPVLERAMGLCQDWHIPLFAPMLATVLGLAYALEGQVTTGLALVEQGVEQEAARHKSRRLAPMVAWLSEALLLTGRLEDARQRAAQAYDLACQYQQRGHQAWALWLLGESTARQASPALELAVGYYRQALALAEALGMRPLQAHCHHGLGRLYGQTDRRELARTELSTAIELYRTMDMAFWLPQVQAALVQHGGNLPSVTYTEKSVQ
jgi:tetratricopeptide (TPR) repeat protein